MFACGLCDDGTDEIVGQDVRPDFLADQLRCFAPQNVHLHRLFQRSQIKLGVPARAIKLRQVVFGNLVTVQQRRDDDDCLGAKARLLDSHTSFPNRIRSYRGTNRRLVAISKNGGETFSDPVEDKTLIEPVCQASILRYPGDNGGILFSNPASTKREKMSVRLSCDEGKTWPHVRTLHEGPAAYSRSEERRVGK